MQYLFGYGFIGGLYLATFGAVLVWMIFGMVSPKLLVWPVLLILVLFPSTSQLTAESGVGVDIYGKGAGFLVFSLYEISIAVAAVCVFLRAAFLAGSSRRTWQGQAQLGALSTAGNPYAVYYWLMAIVVAGYTLSAVLSPRGYWLEQLGRSGVVYLLLQGLLVAATVGAVDSRRALRHLMIALAVAIAARMIWGGLRYLVLGGDPANYYETAGNLFKITFWDINDSILAVLLGAALVWLAVSKPQWRLAARLGLLGFAFYCFVIVALTARRTAQGGALLALLVLWWWLPRGRKWWAVILLAAILPFAAYKLQARINDSRPWLDQIFNAEQKGAYQVDPRRQRFYELRIAMETIAENPVLGVGPAGAFDPPSHFGLEYHNGNYHFVHSGFVHVLLKTGIVGLLIFCGLILAYLRLLHQQWQQAPKSYRTLLAASACSFAAGMPNLVVGTPMIELRTMFVMGLGFSLPLLVARVVQAERTRRVVAGNGVTRRRFAGLGWQR